MNTKLIKKFEDAFIFADYEQERTTYYAVTEVQREGDDLQRLNDQVRIAAGVPLQEYTMEGKGTGKFRIKRPWLD